MQQALDDNSYSGFETGAFEEPMLQFTEVSLLRQTDFHCLFRAKRMGRWYLLKALRSELRGEAIYREMLRKEMEILKKIHHPKIVDCQGIEYVDASPSEGGEVVGECLVMEYIEGQTLKEWFNETNADAKIRENRQQEAESIVNGIIEALAYIHDSMKASMNYMHVSAGHRSMAYYAGRAWLEEFNETDHPLTAQTKGMSFCEVMPLICNDYSQEEYNEFDVIHINPDHEEQILSEMMNELDEETVHALCMGYWLANM